MRHTVRCVLRFVALFAAGSIAACGGGGSGTAIPATPGRGAAAAPADSETFAYGAAMIAGKTSTTPANVGTLKVDVALQLRNAAGLTQYAAAVSTPTSGLYRHFLTPQQIADTYGASAADYAKTAAYFRGFGLRVGGWTQRLALSVAGSQAQMEAAFHTHFVLYKTPLGTLYGPQGKPSFGTALPVAAVANLVGGKNLVRHPTLVHVPIPAGAGQNDAYGYVPQQIAAAFDFNGAYGAGFRGDGITIGIIGTGPIDPHDYATFKQKFNVPGTATITQEAVGTEAAAAVAAGAIPGEGSPTATPPPVTAPCTGALPTCNYEDIEAQIDTEQAAALGYDASVLFYLAYVPAECQGTSPCNSSNPNYLGPQIGISESDDEIEQAIMDDTADVISISFGADEFESGVYFLDASGKYTSSGFGPLEFAALATEGIATFVSSGDSGAQACAADSQAPNPSANCVSYPASDVNVTAVGGVTTPLDNAGRFVGPLTAWGAQTQFGAGGSGGGVSAYIPQPTWQTGAGITPGHRNLPDVSLEADSVTGVATVVNASFGYFNAGPYGGTSVAAPETAAMWALVLSACKQTPTCAARGQGSHPYRLGNAAPLFYGIYNNAAEYPATFYDVTFGNNGVTPCTQTSSCPSPQPTPQPGFNAGVGYDLVTGIGVPFARHLIASVVGV